MQFTNRGIAVKLTAEEIEILKQAGRIITALYAKIDTSCATYKLAAYTEGCIFDQYDLDAISVAGNLIDVLADATNELALIADDD